MTFIVEDGTGLPNATAYIAVAFADSYHADRGNTTWTGTPTVKEQAIIRATDYVDVRFAGQFRGALLNPEQALEFPRRNLIDAYGRLQEGVPRALQNAIAEYAVRALSGDLLPDPETTASGQLLSMRKEVVGPIEETVQFQAGNTVSTIKAYPLADRMLLPLLVKGFGQGGVIRG